MKTVQILQALHKNDQIWHSNSLIQFILEREAIEVWRNCSILNPCSNSLFCIAWEILIFKIARFRKRNQFKKSLGTVFRIVPKEKKRVRQWDTHRVQFCCGSFEPQEVLDDFRRGSPSRDHLHRAGNQRHLQSLAPRDKGDRHGHLIPSKPAYTIPSLLTLLKHK